MNRLRCLLLTLCVITLLIAPMYAQKTTGTLTGTVTDPSGAVVANAPVTVTDPATGATRTATTDNQGVYSVPELQPGTYKVSVKAANFKEAVVNAVDIHVASTSNVNVKLQLGKASEQIEVEANAIQVQTDSAVVGETIDGTQVKELPLNGRSFVALTQLAPGVSGANNFDSKNKGLQGGVDFSVNGNATTNNLFLIDGANNNDVGSNRTILIYPSIESIAEFKMLRNSYGPEYGQASGAVINIATKGGTNNFHGSAFYNGRRDALNATDYQAKFAKTDKPPLTRNDYGGSFGGPIIKNKLFFFWSEEWNRETRGIAQSSCVATAKEVAGDFNSDFVDLNAGKAGAPNWVDQCGAPKPGHYVTDPKDPYYATNPLQFVSNIPVANRSAGATNTNAAAFIMNPAMISAGGAAMYSKYPLPNLSSLVNGNNWNAIEMSQLNWRQENGRMDYNVTKNNTLMFRYTQDSWANPAPTGNVYWGDDNFPALTSSWNQPSKMIIGKLTSTIGGTMVNDAEFAYSNNRINIGVGGTNPGLLQTISNAVPPIYPSSLKNAPAGIPTLWGGFSQYGNYQNYWLQGPWKNSMDIYSFRDDISKVSGAHTWKAGLFLGWNGKNEDNGSPSGERPTFGTADWDTSMPTGNPLANIMQKGAVWGLSEVSTNLTDHLRWRDYEAYVGDTWKAKKNLTLEYGVRYSLLFTPYQPDGLATSFQPFLYDPSKPGSDACNGLWIVPGTSPCTDSNKNFGTNFSAGVAGPNKHLVNQNYHLFAPRLGLAYDPSGTGNWAIRVGLGQFFQRERVSGPYYVISNNAPFVLNGSLGRTLDANTQVSGGSASPGGGRSPNSNIPNSWQWNVSVEHSFAKETALQISYVGNRAIHQTSNYDINAIDPSQTITGCPDVNAAGGTTTAAAWTCMAFQPSSNNAYYTAHRPFANFNQLAYWDHNGDASYHSLQTLFKTRYKRSQFTAAYTWSHSISDVLLDNSDGGPGISSFLYYKNPSLDRGNSPINRPHIFVANATYFFPELKGLNGAVRAIAGGWETSLITTAASGNSVTVTQGNVSDLAPGNSLQTLIGVSGQTGMLRPLMTGVSCTDGRKGNQILNPKAVTLIGYKIGTIPDNIAPRGYCEGPRLTNTDFSLNKNWKVSEKINLQFRMDFFDLFNHPNFRGDQLNNNTPITGVNCGAPDAAGGYKPCSPTNNVITNQVYSNTFGRSNGVVGKAGRELQYGLKMTF
jgi:hypothetical protein